MLWLWFILTLESCYVGKKILHIFERCKVTAKLEAFKLWWFLIKFYMRKLIYSWNHETEITFLVEKIHQILSTHKLCKNYLKSNVDFKALDTNRHRRASSIPLNSERTWTAKHFRRVMLFHASKTICKRKKEDWRSGKGNCWAAESEHHNHAVVTLWSLARWKVFYNMMYRLEEDFSFYFVVFQLLHNIRKSLWSSLLPFFFNFLGFASFPLLIS